MITKKIALDVLSSTLGAGGVTAACTLGYDGVADPLAVSLTFVEPGDTEIEVAWIVGRDLMLRGASSPVYHGEGDIKIRAGFRGGRSVVFLDLNVPEGRALLALPRTEVKEFLDATRQAVPTGGEMIAKELNDFLASLPATEQELDAQERQEYEGESE